jgi:hypothetical protein
MEGTYLIAQEQRFSPFPFYEQPVIDLFVDICIILHYNVMQTAETLEHE